MGEKKCVIEATVYEFKIKSRYEEKLVTKSNLFLRVIKLYY